MKLLPDHNLITLWHCLTGYFYNTIWTPAVTTTLHLYLSFVFPLGTSRPHPLGHIFQLSGQVFMSWLAYKLADSVFCHLLDPHLSPSASLSSFDACDLMLSVPGTPGCLCADIMTSTCSHLPPIRSGHWLLISYSMFTKLYRTLSGVHWEVL